MRGRICFDMPKLRALSISAALIAAAVIPAAAQQPTSSTDRFVGTWVGALQAGGLRLRMAIAAERDTAGRLAGALVVLDQGNQRVPATFSVRGDTLVATISSIGATYTGVTTAARDSLRGTFSQGGLSSPLALGRVTSLPVAARPQDPKPPFPYRTEEVTIESVPGVRLAGTLTIPTGSGPFAAAVLVSGSGPQDRDESLMGHKPFAVLADHLTRQGIAVLRYDDRGTAKSTGSHSTATSDDFAHDAEAAVRFLRARSEIARDGVGIIGHSEGGLIGPMAAARSSDIAYVVMLAGPGIPGDSILILQQRLVAAVSGAPASVQDAITALSRQIFPILKSPGDSAAIAGRLRTRLTEYAATLPPEQRGPLSPEGIERQIQAYMPSWIRYFVQWDPRPALQRVRVPVLALNGSLDVQVPPKENLSAIETALKTAGNRDYRVVEMPQLNHLFQTAKTGGPSEYATIEETMSPKVLELVSTWIKERFPRR